LSGVFVQFFENTLHFINFFVIQFNLVFQIVE